MVASRILTVAAATLLCLQGAVALGQSLGSNYCTAAGNSTGSGALMSASGSVDPADNLLVLRAEPVPPGQLGIFFYGPDRTEVAFGDGYRCIGPGALGLFRLYPPLPTGSGVLTQEVDLAQPPQASGLITFGSTWCFQAWYRDPAAGLSGFNLSDGYEITFRPPGLAWFV